MPRITLLFAVIPLLALSACESSKRNDVQGETPSRDSRIFDQTFTDLRRMVLSRQPPISDPPAEHSQVFVVMLEMGLEDAVASVFAASDGSTSVYLSKGGAIMGTGMVPEVRDASQRFLRLAQTALVEMTPVDSFLLPSVGRIRLHVVAGGGKFSFESSMDDIPNGPEPLRTLFQAGYEVLNRVIAWRKKARGS
jgi:hypothetical protein